MRILCFRFLSFVVSVGSLRSTVILMFVCGRSEGRSKNVWESPKGCLLFSYTIQMEDGKVVPFVQYVVSLAMTEAIKDLCQQKVSAFK